MIDRQEQSKVCQNSSLCAIASAWPSKHLFTNKHCLSTSCLWSSSLLKSQTTNPNILFCLELKMVCKVRTLAIWVSYSAFLGEDNGTPHSSTLAWEIPWMEEPGRLQSMGSQRVRHN